MTGILEHMFEHLAPPGWAIRREWAGGGHEFVAFQPSRPEAERAMARDRSYWIRGPVRPAFWCLVEISRRDFDLHVGRGLHRGRGACRAPDCPRPTDDQIRRHDTVH
jgi:hypothetical protein